MDPVAQTLIVIAFLLLLGTFAESFFEKTGLPDVVWLVGAGILLGPVFKLVSPDIIEPAVPLFGAIALTVILAGGAYRLKLEEVLRVAPRGLLLGIVGFILSVCAVCLFFLIVTPLGWVREASLVYWVMMGAIVGGASALIIMPTVSKGGVDELVAHTLEVESSATDALCVVVTMVTIDLVVKGASGVSEPIVTLGRQICIGVGLGIAFAAIMIPAYPFFRGKDHGFMLFLAGMLALYGTTVSAGGNGAVAVLTSSLTVGNAAFIVPRLIPGAQPDVFVGTETGRIIQQQITFLIKSFFFVLIGLLFPTEPRLIGLGILAALFLLAFRMPAVALAMRGSQISRKQFFLLTVGLPRGLAAGVLATLPMQWEFPAWKTCRVLCFP
ncbi:K(+)/H(+) antiporter NhaP2 [Pontiella desulfatans]|uniref:K(+)/H(+) antiporter NhaP2 n=1 Tax=Pontiella desulfatans TaxID=2750659 RepID=A0A6C2UBI4_PONDE|nr:cation:proton antiporter [Pontiella desulfatans]VGO16646.1 K(+)/H(+) antiporter NhaP2 [Pontiella desulfatans]